MTSTSVRKRIEAVEDEHRRRHGSRTRKPERAALLQQVLDDPDKVREIGARLLGCAPTDAQNARHMEAIRKSIIRDLAP